MKYSKLIEYIDNFVEVNKTFFPDLKIIHSEVNEYQVKDHWEGNPPIWFRKNGIYFYLSKSEDVIYVGKADQQSGEGIGNEATTKKKIKYDKGEKAFLVKLNGHCDKNPQLEKDITVGEFFITGSVVDPSYLSCLLEVFALSLCVEIEGQIPYFNNKIC